MNKVRIKLVSGTTYAFGGKLLRRGDTEVVDRKTATLLLDSGYHDAANNFHPYFSEEGEEPDADADAGQEVAVGESATARKAARTR